MSKDSEAFNFDERVESLVSEPIAWRDTLLAWNEAKLAWDKLKKPIGALLEDYIATGDAEKQKTIELIIRRWLKQHQDLIGEIFKDSGKYNNFIVQIAIQIMTGSDILGAWLYKEIIRKTRLEKEEFKSYKGDIYHDREDLESEAVVKLQTIVADLKLTIIRIEPYLKKAIKNHLVDFLRKETSKERYSPKKTSLDQQNDEQDTVDHGGEPPESQRDKIEYKAQHHNAQGSGIDVFDDLKKLCSPRQLDIMMLLSDGLTTKEVAHKLGISERTVFNEKEALKNNKNLINYLKS